MSEKLIRSGLADAVAGHGSVREVYGEEWGQLLRAKMLEEAAELAMSGDRASMVGEMVDVLEVVTGLRVAYGVSNSELYARQMAKRAQRGDFRRGMAWDPEG